MRRLLRPTQAIPPHATSAATATARRATPRLRLSCAKSAGGSTTNVVRLPFRDTSIDSLPWRSPYTATSDFRLWGLGDFFNPALSLKRRRIHHACHQSGKLPPVLIKLLDDLVDCVLVIILHTPAPLVGNQLFAHRQTKSFTQ